ncbi:MAG TPA: hypothetical protein DEB37_12780 [Lysinibacillus sp.]|nr:hypothetical protein [Lysinibacillus sp.]
MKGLTHRDFQIAHKAFPISNLPKCLRNKIIEMSQLLGKPMIVAEKAWFILKYFTNKRFYFI